VPPAAFVPVGRLSSAAKDDAAQADEITALKQRLAAIEALLPKVTRAAAR
jgi:hypothetical protein